MSAQPLRSPQAQPEGECPSCQTVAPVVGISKDAEVFECPNCSLRFLARDRRGNAVRDNAWYDNFKPEWGETFLKQMGAPYLRQLKELEALVPGRRLADVGCGVGVFVATARRKGWDAVGIEESAYGAQFAKNAYGIEYEKSLRALPEGSFDVVRLSHVLEHIPDPRPFLKELNRVVSNTGVVAILVPNAEPLCASAVNFIRRLFNRRPKLAGAVYPDMHVLGFSTRSLTSLMEREGFVAERVTTVAMGNRTFFPWLYDGLLNRVQPSKIPLRQWFTYWLPMALSNFGLPFHKGDWVVGYFRKAKGAGTTLPFAPRKPEAPAVGPKVAGGFGALAVLSNPLALKAAGLIHFSQPIPKSGFWITSLLSAALGLFGAFSRKYRWAREGFVATLAVAFALVVVDLGLRIARPLEITGETPRPVTAQPNRWGFRDAEPRMDARLRVLVLGDSITWGVGDGLTEENRYHDLFEKALRPRDVDVQNVAQSQWSLGEYLPAYEKVAPEYSPQWVLVGWCMNDINYGSLSRGLATNIERAPQTLREHFRARIKPLVDRTSPNEWFLGTLLWKRSGSLLKALGWSNEDWLDRHYSTYHQHLKAWWSHPQFLAQVRQDLGTLAERTRSRGQRLAVVIFPFRFQAEGQSREPIETFRGLLQELNIEFLDLTDTFTEGLRREEIYSHRDEAHPNTRGHALTAEALLRWFPEGR